MKTLMLITLLSFSSFAQMEKSEMQKMKERHAQCMNSKKTTSNCHEDLIQACKAPRQDCLRMLERMDMGKAQAEEERPRMND